MGTPSDSPTWEVGSTGLMANFANDWFGDGMAPAPDGLLDVTQDQMMPGFENGATAPPEYSQFDPDRNMLVGPARPR